MIDILLIDNGQYRSFDPTMAFSASESYSMVVHYRINEVTLTIEQIREYGKENGAATYSVVGSGASQLANGDILGTWGTIARNAQGEPIQRPVPGDSVQARIIEIDPRNDQVVFDCSVENTTIYRTLRAGIYDGFSEENPYLSTPLNNTSGNDLYDRSVMAWRDLRRWSNTVPFLLNIKRFIRSIFSMLH
jgi:hypothetical protein